MRMLLAFILAIVALAALPAAGRERTGLASSGRTGAVCSGAAAPDRLEGLTPHGDLVLASGHPARLADIRLPEEAPYREMAMAWLRARTGQPVLVRGGKDRDRWNRRTVRIRLTADATGSDLGSGLVAAGLAIVDPGPAEALCQPELVFLEGIAREQRLGLWADDRYNPIDVEHDDRLRDRVGTFVLVEGRIRSVGERDEPISTSGGTGQRTSRSSFPQGPGS